MNNHYHHPQSNQQPVFNKRGYKRNAKNKQNKRKRRSNNRINPKDLSKIRIDVEEYKQYESFLTDQVKEVGITKIISEMKRDAENIPFNTFKNLAYLMDVYIYFDMWRVYPFHIDELDRINEIVRNIDFLPSKTKDKLIEKANYILDRAIDEWDIDGREFVDTYQITLIKHFLRRRENRENLMKMKSQIIYIL